ncbi:MAG: hypothetical protein Q9173_000313 [Seirophora scorigena]
MGWLMPSQAKRQLANGNKQRASNEGLPTTDTSKEHYLPPEHARPDTDEEYFLNAADARTNYPIAYTHASKGA